MKNRIFSVLALSTAAALILIAPERIEAQRGGRGAQSPKEAAPVDLTGYWVSIVTEDWRYRMMTPAKGDYNSVPLNAEGKKVADTWDAAKDPDTSCKDYGAPAVMRQPGRLHITWQDDHTLKVETDAGAQTRLFHFAAPQAPTGEPTWQGYSAAQWDIPEAG